MSTNPVSFRVGFESQIAGLPPEHQKVIRTVWNAITDLQGAIPLLKGQIDTNKTSITTATNTINTMTTSETIITVPSTFGFLNNQSGVTSYSTVPSDNAAYILFSDASPVAVTLSSLGSGGGISLPFYCTILNEGVGLVTVTPADGTISYPNNLASASMPVAQGQAAIMVYDGTNFYAIIIPVQPLNTPAITHEWIDAYNAITGVFTQTQPTMADIIGAPLSGLSTSMGGSAMTAGQTISTIVTVTGAAVGMVASTNPEVYPGDGFVWDAYISAANTVTTRLTATLVGTPTASIYSIRVVQ